MCMNSPQKGTLRQKSSAVCPSIGILCVSICACQRVWHTTAIRIPLLSNRTLAYLEERGPQGEVMIKTRLPSITRARLYWQRHQCVDERSATGLFRQG